MAQSKPNLFSFSARLRVRENNIDRTNKRVYDATGDSLEDTAKEILAYIRRNWSPTSPSAVGFPPAKVTGRLHRSGRVAMRGEGSTFVGTGSNQAIEASIFFTAPYSDILESPDGLNRPFLRPAVEKFSPTIGGKMMLEFRKRLR